MLELRKVSKSYREAQTWRSVLHDASLEVARGEFVAVTGRSGTGKSTLLNLVSGIDIPDSGSVILEYMFNWPGLGLYAVNSILQSDYNAIMGFTIVQGVIFIIVNLMVDISHGLIDPREAR